ncbi:carcinoembryonic antigen-related cell adhesion molecule 1-like isoform X2 [Dendropsophus ebraccatus]
MDKYILSFLLLLLTISGAVTANTLVNGALGGSVHFDVSVPSQANGLISWSFKGVPAALLNPGSSPQYFSVCVGRCTMYGNGSLILNNLTSSDEGTYIISALTSAGNVQFTDTYDLRVFANLTGPVLRYATGTNNPPISGNNATLWCDAGNQTVTTYSFSKDQKMICSGSQPPCRGQYLDFTPISESDSGSHTCTIQNPVSSATSNSLNVTVYASVSNVTAISNITGLVWPGLDSVSLRCSARGTDVSYSWSLRGAAISGDRFHLSDNNFTLTISPVYPTDNGPFTCTAKNLVSNQSSDVTLALASPVSSPVNLTSETLGALWAGQDSASLHCTAQGSAITFSWRINGNLVSSIPPYTITQSISPPSSNLTISPVSKNDTGPITCTASNRANSVTSNAANLNINWAPDGNILCSADPIGENLQLGCSWPGGNPAANVTMIFNATESTSADQVLRNVTSSSNVHGSNLTCNGDQLGKNIKTCTLAFEPPKSPDSPSNQTVKPGGPLTLTVDLISGTQTRASTSSSQVLPAQFIWYHNNNSVNGGKFNVTSTSYASTLKIDKVSASDSGEYKCIASNFIGNATFFFNVKVSDEVAGPDNNGLNGGQIAGIVIGVLAGVAIIGIIVFFVLKKK